MTGRFLRVEEISPTVELADCWNFPADYRHVYRIPSHHLLLIESGTIVARPPGGEFEARAGDLICFRPTEVNEYGNRGPTLIYQAHLEFAPPPRHQATPRLGKWGALPVVVSLGNAFEAARRVFETLCAEVSQEGLTHELRLRSAVWELLAIFAAVVAGQPHPERGLDDWRRLRIQLESRLRENLTVGDLARERNLHPSYLIRQFKHRFGLSPKAFRTQARLREAARLLRTTELPAKSIALDLGFPSVKTFQRVFKHHFGVRPLEVRTKSLFAADPSSATAVNPFQTNRFNLRPPLRRDWKEKYRVPDAEYTKRGLVPPPRG